MGQKLNLAAVCSATAVAILLNMPARAQQQPTGDAPAPASATQPPNSSAAQSAPTNGNMNQAAPAVVDASLTVPAGTKVLLSLESAINTKTTKPGDGVYLVSTFPVIIGPHVLIPAGVYVQGVVDQVERAGRVKGRAKLLMHFTTMIFPNGQVVSIPGGVDNLPGSGGPTVKNAEGEIEQAGNKGKDAANIAKGTAAGAGVGSIAGGVGGHPLAGVGYGAAAGAVGGLVYTLFTRGDDITIAQGAGVEMILQRNLVLEPSQLEGINGTNGAPQFKPAAQQQPLPKPQHVFCPPGGLGCN